MLTQDGCRRRQQNLWSFLPEDIQRVLVGDARHVQYFCGFRPNPVSFSADQSSLLLLERNGTSILIADNFTRRTAAADVYVDSEVIEPWYDHQHSVGNRHAALTAALRTALDGSDSRGLLAEREGVSAESMSVVPAALTSVLIDDQPTSLGTVIRQLRRSKLDDEVALLQRCMDAGAAGQAVAFDAVKSGATELDVYLAVQQAAQQTAGVACVVYGDFRATNAVTFKAGGLPGQYVLRDRDLMILDFSVVIAGYRSDFTNTVAVGQPSDRQAAQADACIAALQAAESCLAPNSRCADVFAAASAVLEERGFAGLPHHAGHGLGMEHPEAPILVPQSTDTLLPGDVVTLEPGQYLEGSGGMRFEHNYRITESGAERLSHHHLGLQRP